MSFFTAPHSTSSSQFSTRPATKSPQALAQQTAPDYSHVLIAIVIPGFSAGVTAILTLSGELLLLLAHQAFALSQFRVQQVSQVTRHMTLPAGGVAHTAPTSLATLPSVAHLKICVFVMGICFLGSAVVYGFYLLLQLGSGRLMLGIRLIRTAQAPLREISYTEGLPLVTCGWLFVLGLYAYVVGELPEHAYSIV